MLGEVTQETDQSQLEESFSDEKKSKKKEKPPLHRKLSSFDEEIRPGSSRSNSSRQTDASSGDLTPETRRRHGKKKKRRSKSKDKLISKEDQKELMDEIKKEDNNVEADQGDDAKQELPEHAVCEVQGDLDTPSRDAEEETSSRDATRSNLDSSYVTTYTQVSQRERQLDDLHNVYPWDVEEHSSNIQVEPTKPNTLVRRHSKKSSDGARGSEGFLSGRHEFEIDFKGAAWGSHCSVGVCTEAARLQKEGYTDLLGEDNHSWAWDIPSRELLHNGQSFGQWGDHVSATPTLIGLTLDRDAGTMSITLDGDYENAKPVFTGLDAVEEPLYPCIATVYSGMEVTIRRHERSPPCTTQEEQGHLPPPALLESPETAVVQKPVLEQANMTAFVLSEKREENEQETGSLASEKIEHIQNKEEELDRLERAESRNEQMSPEETKHTGAEGELRETNENNINDGDDGQLEVEEMVKEEVKAEEGETLQKEDCAETEQQLGEDEEEEWFETEDVRREQQNDNESQNGGVEGDERTFQVEDRFTSINETVGDQGTSAEVEEVQAAQEPSVSYTKYRTEQQRGGPSDLGPEHVEEQQEESPVIEVASLPPEDQYSLQVAFGWDATLKGSKIQIYPGIPTICMIDPSFESKFMGVRCRRTVKSGCHRWRVKELVMNISDGKSGKRDNSHSLNNLILGVVNGEHRTFNYGFSLTQIGRHAWAWEPARRRFHHGATYTPFPRVEGDPEEAQTCRPDEKPSGEDQLGLDLRLGIDIIFDCRKRRLNFEHRGQVYDPSDCYPMFGKEFSPFIVFNGKGRAPVKMEYVSGPEDGIQQVLEYVRKLKSIDWADFAHFRSMATFLVASSSNSVLEEKNAGIFSWGPVSPGVSIVQSNACSEAVFSGGNRQVAISSFPLSTPGRHTIDLSISQIDNLTIGFVTASASQEALVQDASRLGGGLDSWAWFVPGGWLVHAGTSLGRYPYMIRDYDASDTSTIRVVVAQSATESVISLSSISTTGSVVDLGIAFFNLPPQVWLVVTGSAGQGDAERTSVKLFYRSGPSGFVEKLLQMSSQVCTIL